MTDKPTVLIIGQRPDIHIDTVAKLAEDGSGEVLVLDRNSGDEISVCISDDSISGEVAADGKRIPLSDVSCVWWRVKPSSPAEFSGGSGNIEETMRWAEWRHLLHGLSRVVPKARWINPLACHYEISYKLSQLALAVEVGLKVPDSAITNDVKAVLRLFSQTPRVVYKTLSSFIAPPDEIIYTNEVTAQQVRADAGAIQLAPGIFQAYVDKAAEIRVTVVGQDVFAVRIDSQSAEETSIDWRRNQTRDMYEPMSLDNDTLSRLMAFHKRAGLVSATYDLIEQADGSITFLECNPGGQWLWLENALDIPISKAMAALMLDLKRIN